MITLPVWMNALPGRPSRAGSLPQGTERPERLTIRSSNSDNHRSQVLLPAGNKENSAHPERSPGTGAMNLHTRLVVAASLLLSGCVSTPYDPTLTLQTNRAPADYANCVLP